jgi:N-acetylmuramoyl-L-alanine amidase
MFMPTNGRTRRSRYTNHEVIAARAGRFLRWKNISIRLIQLQSIRVSPITVNQPIRRNILQPLALLLASLAFAASLPAQTSPPPASPRPAPSRTLILLDPAHGGPDTGAHLSDKLLEKDLTLAFAGRLRPLLAAAGFSVISTRDTDPSTTFTTDQRAEIANHARPAACIVLHATASGSGVHVAVSALTEADDSNPHAAIPWNTAQATYLPQSLLLANDLGLALERTKLPVLLSRASIRPLDNLTCPALAIELAPLTGSANTLSNDPAYQQHVAEAVVAALSSWRSHNAAASGAVQGAAR